MNTAATALLIITIIAWTVVVIGMAAAIIIGRSER